MDPYTSKWLNEYPRKRERQRRFRALKRFEEWLQRTHGTEPNALLKKARRGGRGPEKAERMLREYYEFLIDEQKNAKSSAAQWYALLRSFFTVNGVDLGRYPQKVAVQSVYEKRGALSQDDVKRMVQSPVNSKRDQFVIAFLAQTGQRLGVLTAMKRNMIKEAASGHGIVNTPPVLRNPLGENVNESGLPYTFVVGRDTMRLLGELQLYEGGWLVSLSQRQIGRIVDEAARAIRIQHKKLTDIGRSWSSVHPNTFRKYWRDRMIEAGTDRFLIMHMMGYKVPSVFGSWDPVAKKLVQAYENAESKLEVL